MDVVIILLFAAGYLLIILEQGTGLNKAASALLTGVACWVALVLMSHGVTEINGALMEHLAEIAAIVFFLLGAMTIVELIESHGGFILLTRAVKTRDPRKLLWIIAILAFFLSAVLDNLTTAIIMVMLSRKLLHDRTARLYVIGAVIIAANAGGAWSPLGDVTTTMLWIGQRITSLGVIASLFLPSLVNLLLPLTLLTFMVGKGKGNTGETAEEEKPVTREGLIILIVGVALLCSIPVFKALTHLPPFMGMLFALGILWAVTEFLHHGKEEEVRYRHSVLYAIRKMDMTSILFFVGILLAVTALQTAGILDRFGAGMFSALKDMNLVAFVIGLVSAVLDNVPLVAAAIGMYPLSHFPTDHSFWKFLAYSAGTGGSILVIGSAAGVAAMGIEKIGFFDYLKKTGWLAAAGYFAGAGVYWLLSLR